MNKYKYTIGAAIVSSILTAIILLCLVVRPLSGPIGTDSAADKVASDSVTIVIETIDHLRGELIYDSLTDAFTFAIDDISASIYPEAVDMLRDRWDNKNRAKFDLIQHNATGEYELVVQ